jgi:hypothetical protein
MFLPKAVHQCTKDMRYTVYIALKFIELTLNLQYIRETSTLSSVYIVFSCPRRKKQNDSIANKIKFVSLQHPWGEIHGSRMRFLLYPDKPKSGKFQ